ncbi:response regulator [Luteimonas sp. Y-2-2-4F]|nr:hybrid sensor histidine kinase/response regulator [Luteimonas sp. Y-2-2-4F]MCD9030796.1 response regulator [Luteimonas sp. Y-2-2-4F]
MARVLLGWLLWLGAVASGVAALPETPRFRPIGVQEGLPSTELLGLARDRAGYLWIATGDGLARYDGVDMRVWRHDPDDPGSLRDNFVQAVHVDARDRLWVATERGGLARFSREDERFQPLPGAEAITDHNVLSMTDRDGELWFGAMDGAVYRWSEERGLHRFGPDPGDPDALAEAPVLSMATDPRGRVWAATFAGLALSEDGESMRRVALPGNAPYPRVFFVGWLGDTVWAGTEDGVYFLGDDGAWRSPEWSPMFEAPNAAVSMAREADGSMWIGSQRNLWRVAPGGIPRPVETGAPLQGRAIMQILLQDDGALWVPLHGAGLGYLRSDWREIAQFDTRDGLMPTLYSTLAPARDGGIWLGSMSGVQWLSPDGRVESFDEPLHRRLSDYRVYAIAETERGTLWLGVRGGLVRVGTDGSVEHWSPEDERDAALGIMTDQALIAPDGTLWTSSRQGGLQQRDAESGRVLRNVPAGELGDHEWMEIAPDGSLWTSGDYGVARLDAARGVLEPVLGGGGHTVVAFAFAGPDALWMHSMNGLDRYRRDGQRWRFAERVDARHGLPALSASALRIDRRGRIWVSTTRGLFRWDPEARRMRHFGVHIGFRNQEFVYRALTLTESGLLAGATRDAGVVMIDADAPDGALRRPVLEIDRVAVREGGAWRERPGPAAVVLPPDQSELRVSARLLSFDDPAANRYWSKLDGVDSDWLAHGESGDRVLVGLAPGRYTMRLRAADAHGAESAERSLGIVVQPPWWRTPTALAAFVALAVLLLFAAAAGYRRRLRRRHAWKLAVHKREVAEQASVAKTRFLATLGHEVRTPMTGVLGMSELLLGSPLDPQQRRYTESIRRAGDHLMRLVDDALDLARIEAGRLELDPQPFDPHALLQDVSALMGPLAMQRGLGFRERIDPGLPRWLVGDPVRVRQILLNLLGNAIKFTEAGHVALEAARTATGVRFEVADTGPGLNEEQCRRVFRRFEQADGARTAARYGGSGLGLAICQELAQQMGGGIEIDSAPGEGTRFRVDLPLAAAPEPADGAAQAGADAVPPMRLLVVEDDPTVADVIAGLLRAQGHAVTHAPHALAALLALRECAPDVALVDLDLPGIDGFALVGQLRAQAPGLPAVAITARADAEAEPAARAAGFDGFLRKPLTGELLAAALRQARSRPDADAGAAA